IPVAGLLWFALVIPDVLAILGVGLSILAFFYFGIKYSLLSLTDMIEKYKNRRITKLPIWAKAAFLVVIIVLPLSMVFGVVLSQARIFNTYTLTMEDGTKLVMDVYLAPGVIGPQPVIYVQTPYNKSSELGAGMYTMLYLPQGYHIVVQDVRGTGVSEGGDADDFILYNNTYTDSNETIEWILDQTWCNGNIASVGGSGLGMPQFYLAGTTPNGLVCQSIMIASPNVGNSTVLPGGVLKENVFNSWLQMTVPDSYQEMRDRMLPFQKQEAIFYNNTALDMDGGPEFKNVNVSAVHIGGWYDMFQQFTLDSYMGYDDEGMVGAQGKQALIMGPWTHGAFTTTKQGELTYPANSIGMDPLNLFSITKEGNKILYYETAIFDYYLRGIDLPTDFLDERVSYYMMGAVDGSSVVGANEWKYASDWPITTGVSNVKWNLTDDGKLVNTTVSTNANLSYTYNPKNCSPTVGGLNLMYQSGPWDQAAVEERTDVLIFETDNLTAPLNVLGHMEAHLWIKSNCTNTDFMVRICDVYPDGRSMLINDGAINAKRRDGLDRDAADLDTVTEDIDEAVEVVVDLWSTALQFNTNHKIRIIISSSNYPRYGTNPNTGVPIEAFSTDYMEYNIANNTICVGPDYPSHIVLPIQTTS
ncbi:MAG: CocE/NonD family hydrolase, partial [archaeon]|nr:CocE/NonD family hydrolase [archaeon]